MDKQMWLVELDGFYGPEQRWMAFDEIERLRRYMLGFTVIGSTGCQV